jgi:putative oxidoreductase
MNQATSKIDSPTPSQFRLINNLSPLAWPLIRVVTGLWLMPHGAQKLFGWFGGHGLTGTGQFFDSIGMSPGLPMALAAGIIEFFGGLMLALGLLTRPVALVVAAFLMVAMTVHIHNGFFWTNGGLEYPLMWAVLAIALLIRGGGYYSLDARLGLRF